MSGEILRREHVAVLRTLHATSSALPHHTGNSTPSGRKPRAKNWISAEMATPAVRPAERI